MSFFRVCCSGGHQNHQPPVCALQQHFYLQRHVADLCHLKAVNIFTAPATSITENGQNLNLKEARFAFYHTGTRQPEFVQPKTASYTGAQRSGLSSQTAHHLPPLGFLKGKESGFLLLFVCVCFEADINHKLLYFYLRNAFLDDVAALCIRGSFFCCV